MKNFSIKKAAFIGVSALALSLGACGNKEGGSAKPGSANKKVAQLTSGKSSLDKAYSLKGASELDVDALAASLGFGDEFKYDSVTFDSKKGATILTNVTAPDADGVFNIGTVELYGVETANIETVKAAAKTGDLLQIFDRVRLFDLRFSGDRSIGYEDENKEPELGLDPNENGNLTIAAMEIDRLMLRPQNKETLKDIDDGKGFATMMNSVSLGGVTLKDIAGGGGVDGKTGLAFAANEMRMGSFGAGKIGAISATGLTYDLTQGEAARAELQNVPGMGALVNGPLANFLAPARQQVEAKSFTWRGADFSGLLPYLAKREMPPVDAKNLISIGGMDFTNVVSKVNGKTASEISSSSMDDIEFAWVIPKNIKFNNSDDSKMHLSAYMTEGQEDLINLLQKNDIESVGYGGSMDWKYDEDKGTADLDYDINMDGLANIDFEVATSGMPVEQIATTFATKDPTSMLAAGAFNGFRLEIADEKLLDTVFDVMGMQQGQDGATLRQQTVGQLGLVGAMGASMNPKIADYVTALSGFISSGGTLEIEMTPNEPVSFLSLTSTVQQAPQTLPDVLNISVTHSK